MAVSEKMLELAATAIMNRRIQPDFYGVDKNNVCLYDTDKELAKAALTAALSDQVVDWQPIETAPKDGTTISVWHKVWKCPVSARYIAGRKSQRKWVEATITTEWPDAAFTHWQPLPIGPVPASTPVGSS